MLSGMPLDLLFYVVLQICQSQRIVVVDPFLEVPPMKVDRSVKIGEYGGQGKSCQSCFSPLTHIMTKHKFCFIVISLHLQDLNFVRKEPKVFMEGSQK